MNIVARAIVAAFVLLTSAADTAHAFERSRSVILTRDENLGDTGFAIRVSTTFQGTIAPDGTRFEVSTGELNGLTVQQLISRFVGTWIIEDTFTIPGGMQFHQFSLSESQLLNFPPSPTLLSPPAGATVPPRFEVTFPAGNSVIVQGAPVTFESPTDTSRTVVVPFEAGVLEKSLLLTPLVNTRETFSATPITPNPVNTFSVELRHTRRSAGRTVTVVVPEPASIGLACVTFVGMALKTRRRK